MSKTRSFSIYLLKPGQDATNSLKEDTELEIVEAANLPEGAVIYVLDAERKRPWWRGYFDVREDLWQEHKGALVFIPVDRRCFALSFGQVYHHLDDSAYEYDFGLRVTLNSVDPKELKSADMLAPGDARRKRTQVPISTELTHLDFDGNSEIIKSLTGKVKKQYAGLFKSVTGSTSLKVGLKLEPNELTNTCSDLLGLYESNEYKEVFPNIQNIVPIKDPTKVKQLDNLLISALREKEESVTLTIPDIVDYRNNTHCTFMGEKKYSQIYPDIDLTAFYDFLGEDFNLATLTVDRIKSFRMMLTDTDGSPGRSYSIYRSLVFDKAVADENVIYHFCDGEWFQAEKGFVERPTKYLDTKCEAPDLLPYNHDAVKDGKPAYSEENYNASIPAWNAKYICLDQCDISPIGNTAVEPCDVYTAREDGSAGSGFRSFLYHLKISTRSSQLSHLFNQGVNAIELIKGEQKSREKLKGLVENLLGNNDKKMFLSPIEACDLKVIFGIITHKDSNRKSANLPLFSKISLTRNMQWLDLMTVPCALIYIRDESPKKHGHQKHRQLLVEVHLTTDGYKVFAVAGQGVDAAKPIKRCSKQVTSSAPGTRYKIYVNVGADGTLSSHHSWPVDPPV